MIVMIVLIVAAAAVGIAALVTHSASSNQASSSTSNTQTSSSTSTTLTFQVPSGAMEPAIPAGSTISVAPLQNSTPQRGDIVVFSPPPLENSNCAGPPVSDIVKRVIGLPGEMISLGSGRVYINGRPLPEPWLQSAVRTETYPGPSGASYSLTQPYRVPSSNYIVMGDNRTFSCDSRYWGPVPLSDMVGKAHLTG
jgi:signal peptidase I